MITNNYTSYLSTQQPLPDAIWRVEFCLIVPKNVDLGENAHIGSPGIIYRAKVLLFVSCKYNVHVSSLFLPLSLLHTHTPPSQLNLIRQSDHAQVTLPILHDPKSNNNFVAKRSPSSTRVEQPPALQYIDQVLRKMHVPGSEFMSSPNESSLAHSIRHLLTLNIPV